MKSMLCPHCKGTCAGPLDDAKDRNTIIEIPFRLQETPCVILRGPTIFPATCSRETFRLDLHSLVQQDVTSKDGSSKIYVSKNLSPYVNTGSEFCDDNLADKNFPTCETFGMNPFPTENRNES